MLATMTDAVNEFVLWYGSNHKDQCWILSQYDTWHKNPFFIGIQTPHPELSEVNEEIEDEEDEIDEEEEEYDDGDCSTCLGTGEGSYDGSSCHVCRGSGLS
jgi:hypothetical protein